MSRIRTIKPEFWSSTTLARVPREVRLVFIGLWNEADDEGRLLASPKRLAGALFPNDEDVDAGMMGTWLSMLESAGVITRYTAAGVAYAWVHGFGEHQRVDKRWASRLPPPPPGGLTQHPASLAQHSASPARVSESLAQHSAPEMSSSGNDLSSEMISLGSERAAPAEREKPLEQRNAGRQNPDAPPPLLGVIIARTGRPHLGIRRGAGFMEDPSSWPQTPQALLEQHPELRVRFQALDGSPGQPALVGEVSASWVSFSGKRDREGPALALEGLISWIGRDYGKHHERWVRAGGKAPAPNPEAAKAEHRASVDKLHRLRCRVAGDLGVPLPPHPFDESEAYDAWAANPAVWDAVSAEVSKRRSAS